MEQRLSVEKAIYDRLPSQLIWTSKGNVEDI